MLALSDNRFWHLTSEFFSEATAGCYRLFACGPDGRAAPINRLLGTDPKGTLYIGTSLHVPKRATDLRRSLLAAYRVDDYIDTGPHLVGAKIAASEQIRQRFPWGTLFVELSHCVVFAEDGAPDHFRQEADAISEYQRQFGEAPPLNG